MPSPTASRQRCHAGTPRRQMKVPQILSIFKARRRLIHGYYRQIEIGVSVMIELICLMLIRRPKIAFIGARIIPGIALIALTNANLLRHATRRCCECLVGCCRIAALPIRQGLAATMLSLQRQRHTTSMDDVLECSSSQYWPPI